ncbi:helix-turn-helix transcriptional regulator [Allokutzneria sp. A3M-2-11 16]|uniref:helix-turn-helix domain-containing protein n=1 Tax=Allokutzneria sp. A3M-2-11 16 TaxID=2962043 RepID=UPI0020B6BF9B|nr:helix-turn-helix transcriptional regulator [Allokutzneria sp. A3M-2-11 16]MCP3801869.1 helix-turn-helix transcriptional regulator [Allokutzneria sp. A3M-2-11 16]
MPDDRSIGQNIAAARKLAGLTQQQYAALASYSISTVTKVESGHEPASPAYIAAACRFLHVDQQRLTNTPYRETLDEEGPLVGMPELQALLAEGKYVRAEEPGSLDILASKMERLERLYRNDKGRQALAELTPLIRRLYGAVHASNSDGERGRANALLSAAYVLTERLCRRFGFMSLAAPSLDMLESVAVKADDPLFAAQAKIKRARILMYHDGYDLALSLVEEGAEAAAGDSQESLAVRGYGHLCGAIVAVRGRRRDLALDHLSEAADLARRVEGESDAYGTLFGIGNVGVHNVAVNLEIGEYAKAALDGWKLKLPKDMAPPRQGHHWQDTARAFLLMGEPRKSLAALNRARKAAPQQTRLHPQVRETLRGIAMAERSQTDSLSNFSAWVGVRL